MKRERQSFRLVRIIAFLLLLTTAHSAMAAEPLARITVKAGASARLDTPVSIPLDGIPVPLDSGLRLEELRGEKRLPVPSQIEPGYSPRLWWILSGATPPGGKRVYELVLGQAVEAPLVEVALNDATIRVLAGGREVLQYHHAVVQPPEGVHEKYERSAFIHPFRSPAGAVLTRIHPADHIHHMGLWNPWTKTKFEGRDIDFWNLGQGQGTVRFKRFVGRTRGPVFGGFRAEQAHVDLSAPGGEKTALTEVCDIRVWNVSGKQQRCFLWDFTTTQRCASPSPFTVARYRYGGIGFRATAEWDKGDYLTSGGKTRKDGHATRARWCIVHGPTSKGPAGVVFMSHPNNHEHPEPMRIWNGRPEIFFNFCPVQQADWVIEPGRDHVLKYRLYVYDGTITPESAERYWQDFGHPPEIELKRF